MDLEAEVALIVDEEVMIEEAEEVMVAETSVTDKIDDLLHTKQTLVELPFLSPQEHSLYLTILF